MLTNGIIIAGVGGQGTLLASKLIAAAALEKGLHVRTTETIGMAQRGGSVTSHIRMGMDIHSPLVSRGTAQAIIAFEPAEAVRVSPYLTEYGTIIVCDSPIAPVTSSLSGDGYRSEDMLHFLKSNIKNLVIMNGAMLAAKCGGVKTLNTALIGAAAQLGLFPFGVDALTESIKKNMPERFVNMNLITFQTGVEMCKRIAQLEGEQT